MNSNTNKNEINQINTTSQNDNNQQELNNKLQNLQFLFPFLQSLQNNSQDNYSITKYTESEYNNIVKSLLSPTNSENSNNTSELLQGKKNIIDELIQKYSKSNINISNNSLKLIINKNFNMLNDIGYRMSNLLELDLEGSEIESISDIGSSFKNLIKLNVSHCGLKDLSGLICFPKLQELNAAYNKINDLIDIEMCDELVFIDVSYNLISDEDNLIFLNSCSKLKKAVLIGNKITKYDKNVISGDIEIILQ